MKYQVKYQKGLIFGTIKGVVADGYVEAQAVRYFIKENGERVEVPADRVFWFSYERNEMAKQREKEKFQELQSGINQARARERG
jgi:hypothetical protein